MGRTKPGAGAKIRLPGQGAQPPSLILCEILKLLSHCGLCPLYKRTLRGTTGMSALCQKRTSRYQR
jgi:hypothetical protein